MVFIVILIMKGCNLTTLLSIVATSEIGYG